MRDLNNIYEYRYMDEQIKKMREISLKDFLIEKDDRTLKFFDLDIFMEPTNFFENVSNILFKSKLDDKITLNKFQIEILNIMKEHNLFLSAPTSFGKTFVMLEFIKRNTDILNNIIFIIPTIALVNELLKKIYNYFSEEYNICTNGSEDFAEKNIFIFVPERSDIEFLNKVSNIDIDFLIFDEIYKLQPSSSKELKTDDRIIYMNKVYLDLVNKAKKFALLGPYINSVEFEQTKIDVVKYYTNYMPVYNEIIVLDEGKKWDDFIKLEHQLIYFKTPESIYNNIQRILEKIPVDNQMEEMYRNELHYLEKTIGKEWYVIDLLRRGIGIHHGKTPMFLRKFYENEYNNGNIKVLLCTNTLMEGINTPTDSLIIVDDPGSAFKLNNIIGRVGRLNVKKPKIGQVIISSSTILSNITNTNDWCDLKILAEGETATIDDEVLYLNKKYEKEEKNEEFKNKLEYLNRNFNITPDTIMNQSLELNKVYKFFQNGIYNELNSGEELIEFVKTTLKLIPGPSFAFESQRFDGLNNTYPYLPYKYYLCNLLLKISIKDIIAKFNERYNLDGNISNINNFIDSLYVLSNFIKFKFSKIINYVDLKDQESNIKNPKLQMFVGLISNYHSLETTYKILDDLGIDESDAVKILNILNISNIISSSTMIRLIRKNKDVLIKAELSPFTINNIINM